MKLTMPKKKLPGNNYSATRSNPRVIEVDLGVVNTVLEALMGYISLKVNSEIASGRGGAKVSRDISGGVDIPNGMLNFVDGTPINTPVRVFIESIPEGQEGRSGIYMPFASAYNDDFFRSASLATYFDNSGNVTGSVLSIAASGGVKYSDLTPNRLRAEAETVRIMLLREFTHLLESTFSGEVAPRLHVCEEQYNLPQEVRAIMQEVIYELRQAELQIEGLMTTNPTFNRNPQRALELFSFTWQEISHLLTEANRSKIVSAVVNEFHFPRS